MLIPPYLLRGKKFKKKINLLLYKGEKFSFIIVAYKKKERKEYK